MTLVQRIGHSPDVFRNPCAHRSVCRRGPSIAASVAPQAWRCCSTRMVSRGARLSSVRAHADATVARADPAASIAPFSSCCQPRQGIAHTGSEKNPLVQSIVQSTSTGGSTQVCCQGKAVDLLVSTAGLHWQCRASARGPGYRPASPQLEAATAAVAAAAAAAMAAAAMAALIIGRGCCSDARAACTRPGCAPACASGSA